MAIKQKISNAANKVEKAVAKVDEVIAKADPVADNFLDLIKNSKRSMLVILIIGFLVWLIT
jgi:preprotein translocase subunit Sss1